MTGIPVRFVILALSLEALFTALLLAARADRTSEAIVLLVAAGALYTFGVYWTHRETVNGPALPLFIIAVAVVFRLTLWPLHFPTTDDAYRYRWEGKLQARGGNPYQVRPSDDTWAFLRDPAYTRVPVKQAKAGYGPAWELISVATYRTVAAAVTDEQRQVFWFKVPAALADMGVIWVLAALLGARGLPAARVLAYAWSPLPVWEFWANGHNDSVALLPVVAGVLACVNGRIWIAFALLGAAIAVKLWPVVLVPALAFRRDGARLRVHLRQCLLAAAVALAFALPYWSGVWENVRFMTGFVGGWRNNDSLFGGVLWATGDIYRAKYITFALVAAAALTTALRARGVTWATLWAPAALLLLSSNCHPWYLTWFLPMLAFHASPALYVWVVLMPVAYQVWPDWREFQVWDGNSPVRWLIYVPVFAVLIAQTAWTWRNGRRVPSRQVGI